MEEGWADQSLCPYTPYSVWVCTQLNTARRSSELVSLYRVCSTHLIPTQIPFDFQISGDTIKPSTMEDHFAQIIWICVLIRRLLSLVSRFQISVDLTLPVLVTRSNHQWLAGEALCRSSEFVSSYSSPQIFQIPFGFQFPDSRWHDQTINGRALHRLSEFVLPLYSVCPVPRFQLISQWWLMSESVQLL